MSQKAVVINLTEDAEPNFYAEDMASIINGLLGDVSGILPTGERLTASKVDNNTVRIASGDYSNQGYILRIPGGETIDLKIGNGTQDLKRYDLIVAEFSRSASGEKHVLKVIQGVPALNPAVPNLTEGDLNCGAELRQEAVYKITVNGLTLVSIERIAKTIGSLSTASIENAINDKIVISKTQPAYADGRIWIRPED